MRRVAAVARKKRWYRRPVGVATSAAVALVVIVGALGGGSERDSASSGERSGSTPTATATPDTRADVLARADEALAADDYRAVLAAVDGTDDLVDRYERKIARRLLRRARNRLRSSSERSAISHAQRSQDFHRFPEARTIAATARSRHAAEKRAARLASDRRMCDSGEREVVRFRGAAPAGCSGYAIEVAADRAREAAELEEADQLPDVSTNDGAGSDGAASGNWCGATRDGDGDGIWCEGR